jgi:hypothetical protein
MQQPMRWILRNTARRPVEIHGPAGVTVVPPSGSIEVDELDLQCQALVRRGSLSCHPAPPPPVAAEVRAEPAAEAPAAVASAPDEEAPEDATGAPSGETADRDDTQPDTKARTGEHE